MKLVRVLFVLLVLSFNVTALTDAREATQAKATILIDISIERAGAETKVHLKADGVIKDYSEVTLKKNIGAHRPDRMYLDLKNLHLAGPIPARKAGTALSQVRNAVRSDGIRVVFDSSLDSLFDYTISEVPDGLLVTIRETSAKPAAVAAPPSAPKAIAKSAVVVPPIPVEKIIAAPATIAAPIIENIAIDESAAFAAPMPEDQPEAEPEKIRAPAVETMQPEPRAAGDLNLLIVTAETAEQTQEWLDRPNRNTDLQILKTAMPDQMINTSFLVTGVTPDSNGEFAVEVSFTLLDPNGKVELSERNFAKTSGRAPARPAFLLAEPVLDITLSESDPAGEYTIIGIVQDLTSNKMFRTSHRITLEK